MFEHTPKFENLTASWTKIGGKKVPERSMITSRFSENFAHLSSGNIDVFQHTPKATYIDVGGTQVSGKKFPEHSVNTSRFSENFCTITQVTKLHFGRSSRNAAFSCSYFESFPVKATPATQIAR